MSYFFQLVVSGIVVGSIYALAALGFVLIYKSSKVLNIAHGQIIAAGAFIAYALTGMVGIPIYISFFLSMVITFFLAMSVERIFLRRLIGEPIISVIMVTIGLMSILDGLIFLTPFGSVNFSFPRFLPQTLISLGGVSISWTQLVGVIVTFVMIGGFSWFFKKSTVGISMRAVSDDQFASMSVGISVPRVFGLAWATAGSERRRCRRYHRQYHRTQFRDAAGLRYYRFPGGYSGGAGFHTGRRGGRYHHGRDPAVCQRISGRQLGAQRHRRSAALYHLVNHPAFQAPRTFRHP
jgi:hypothetical protein